MDRDGSVRDGHAASRWLLLASQTAAAPALHAWLAERSVLEPGAHWHILVPASPLRHQEDDLLVVERRRGDGEDPAFALARWRLERALGALEQLGLSATGAIGEPDPVRAARTALRARTYDRLLLCTLPIDRSCWLRRDVDGRLRRTTGLPLTHLELDPQRTVEPDRRRRGTSAAARQAEATTLRRSSS